MASRYHPLFGGIWKHPKLEGASFEEKGFFVYLFSNDHMRASGIYRASDAELAATTELPVATVQDYLRDLQRRGLIVRDGRWIFVLGYLKRQPKQPYLLAGVRTELMGCTSPGILTAFAEYYSRYSQWSADRLAMLAQGSGNGVTKPTATDADADADADAGTDADADADAETTLAARTAARALEHVVAHRKPDPAEEGRPTWAAYAQAYEQRYLVQPTRNARVNKHMTEFLSRVPKGEAPRIAAFYVQSNYGYYVRESHPVWLLAKHAEKLRTEWLSGRRMTEAQAREHDRRAGARQHYGEIIEDLRRRDEEERHA